MHLSSSVPLLDRHGPASLSLRILTLLVVAVSGACGGSGGGGGQSGTPGELALKPNGDPFVSDENQTGAATDVVIAEVLWGRLVDIHQVDANGVRVEEPVFRDFVIDPSIRTDPARKFVVDRNPVTQRERLTIQEQFDPLENEGAFEMRLKDADQLPVVLVRDDDGTSPPPFTAIPRNACMVVRVNDCLRDDAAAATALNQQQLVKVFTGYPPTTPFQPRILFDPNHGAIAGGFHSTRVLIDMSVSSAEAAEAGLAPNPVGLPASSTTSVSTNLSIRIPTVIDFGSSQFQVLTNLAGIALDVSGNGPVDFASPTQDVVRAARSGNPDTNTSNGFLPDQTQPRLVGGWPVTVTDQDQVDAEGFDFLLDITFDSLDCQADPRTGDVIQVGGAFLTVTAPGARVVNTVTDLAVRSAFALVDDGDPLTDEVVPDDLVDAGSYEAPFSAALGLAQGCWVSFVPGPLTPPAAGVSTAARVAVRFSEPMDPDSLSPFDGFLVVNDEPSGTVQEPDTQNLVVGTVTATNDLTVFSFEPTQPLPHVLGDASSFHVRIAENARDLAGNELIQAIAPIPFTLIAAEATQENDAIVLRFGQDDNDEYAPAGDPGDLGDGLPDLRGQFLLDSTRGMLRGRPVALSSWPIERANPVINAMAPIVGGLFTPLNPLGAKLQMVWRYCDMGWAVADETKHNLDVLGLNWSPVGGLVISDFFDQFEITLGHSHLLPDEGLGGGTSGLAPMPATFDSNYLQPTANPPVVVHNRALGYAISGAEIFATPGGTPIIPFPLNRGLSPDVTYTWRDTGILALGGDGDMMQPGIPTLAEANAGVLQGGQAAGAVARFAQVPSFGLPLLVEIKCFPSDRGLGQNRFDAQFALPVGFSAVPAFRAYSSGGVNGQGVPVQVLPDSEDMPRGSINPGGNLPSADDVFYLGQLDTVVRVSRMHTVWLDAGLSVVPDWRTPVIEPAAQPLGTRVELAFRSAVGFQGPEATDGPFDGTMLDPYGNSVKDDMNMALFTPQGETEWSPSIAIADDQRYVQVRLTFVNNIQSGVGPEITALALPYDF